MKKKWLIGIVVMMILLVCSSIYFYRAIYGDEEQMMAAAKALEEEMEDKYGIHIIESDGFYTHMVGYAATLTAEDGITFDAWWRPDSKDGSVDFYEEEVWRKKGLSVWGHADQYVPYVEKVDLNVGYRNEEVNHIPLLTRAIDEVKDTLWLTLYVDLKVPYRESEAKKIEEGIYHYYEDLQNKGADGVELIVRHKDDSGSYMISPDEHGKLPEISSVEDISSKFDE